MTAKFTKILVGVDLSGPDGFVCPEPTEQSVAAIERAKGIAKNYGSELLLMYVADPSSRKLPANKDGYPVAIPSIEIEISRANDALEKIVRVTKEQGLDVNYRTSVGKSWVELIFQVERGGHDLLISGTRRFGRFKSMIVGSTGMKLLRHCPCPVWLTEPQSEKIERILVAHDLRPVGDEAMKTACELARSLNAQLHVFHAIHFPEQDDFLPGSTISSANLERYRSLALEHIQKQLVSEGMTDQAKIHLEYGEAYAPLYNLIKSENIDLLTMGTVARSGFRGIMGSTAENILPHTECSILAIKPPDFISSIKETV